MQSMPDHVVFRIDVPVDIDRTTIPLETLPKGWQSVPAPEEATKIGDEWFKAGDTALLTVRSALVPIETNVLINPEHDDFSELEISGAFDLPLDKRLFS